MTDFPISGGCLCGAVRYTVLEPAKSVEHCHCSICRRKSGTLSSPGAVVDRDMLRIDRGAENLTSYEHLPGGIRKFCRTCGCPLFFEVEGFTEKAYFMPATLDGGVHPGHTPGTECHVFVDSKAEWDEITGDLPQFPERSEWSRF